MFKQVKKLTTPSRTSIPDLVITKKGKKERITNDNGKADVLNNVFSDNTTVHTINIRDDPNLVSKLKKLNKLLMPVQFNRNGTASYKDIKEKRKPVTTEEISNIKKGIIRSDEILTEANPLFYNNLIIDYPDKFDIQNDMYSTLEIHKILREMKPFTGSIGLNNTHLKYLEPKILWNL